MHRILKKDGEVSIRVPHFTSRNNFSDPTHINRFAINTFDFFTDTALNQPKYILEKSNRFKYTENVNAAYVNYQQQLNAKWSIQTGLRLEQTNSEGKLTRADGKKQPDDNVKRDYLNLFPSAALTWNIDQTHSPVQRPDDTI